MTDAFRRIGVDVRTLGDSTGNRIPWPRGKEDGTWDNWTELDPKYAWQSNGDITAHWPDWTPDLIVHMDSSFAYHHPVYADVVHIIFGADNHVRDYRQAGIARYFLMHKNATIQPYDDNTEHLPCAYDPQHFTPSPIPYEQRDYDVAMIGVLYPQRIELLNALAAAGLKVLGGTGWVYEQYAAAYHNARISLCCSANGDLAQRIFETAALGCAILTDRVADLMDAETNKSLGLQGFVTYDGVEECVAQARHLLETEPLEHAPIADGDEIVMQLAGGAGMGAFAARQMCESVLGRHTWDARAARIVEWFAQHISDWQGLDTDPDFTVVADGGGNDGLQTETRPEDGLSDTYTHDDAGDATGENGADINQPKRRPDEGHATAIEEETPPEKPKRKKRGH